MDGVDTALMMHSLDLLSQPLMLMITAYGDQLAKEELERAGIAHILSKPVTPSFAFSMCWRNYCSKYRGCYRQSIQRDLRNN